VIDVLIAGAGPTGLTLAVQLQRLGVPHQLVDAASGPSTTSKAIGLQYRASELLVWLGVFDTFERAAAPGTVINLHSGPRRVAQLRLAADPSRAGTGGFVPRPVILPQNETERILGDRLGELGGQVTWGSALERLEQDADGVTAVVAGRTVRARYLVGCDGAHSAARKLAGISFEGKTFPHDFIMADVAMRGPQAHGEAHAWLHPDGMLSTITMPGEDRWRLFIEAGTAEGREVDLPLVQELYAARTGDASTRLTDPTWLTRFKIHSRMVDRFREGRVFLAGDAAHLHSPSGGQGITTGMQDAYNLSWKLAQVLRHGAPPALLDTYDAERRPAARQVLDTTERNTNLLFARSRLGKWLRDRLVMPLLGTGPVQKRLFARLSQLDANYRTSPLSRGPGAGDRAPDVVMRTEAGLGSLFADLATARFVAWLTPGPGFDPQPWASRLEGLGVLVRVLDPGADVHGDLARLYGADAPGVTLIRPDGYVGFVGRPFVAQELLDHLERLWGRDAVATCARASRA
jgi:2-polyprenyl-6-methoxyphenol hydroxylase-like FAD-dependent oxidoreductase